MKNNGLQNRFPAGTREKWFWWYECMVCGENTFDALHHIISPACKEYKKGNFNHSVLNSCPICNLKCHIGKDGELHAQIPELLGKTKRALESLHYKLTPLDRKFLEVYADLYAKDKNKHDKQCSCGCMH